MTTDQKRKFYRLEPSAADPVIVHLQKKAYKAVDISVTGIKAEVHHIKPEWKLDEVLTITIELPNVKHHPKIHTEARICYMNANQLALEFVKLDSMDKRKISDYLLQLSKNLGYL